MFRKDQSLKGILRPRPQQEATGILLGARARNAKWKTQKRQAEKRRKKNQPLSPKEVRPQVLHHSKTRSQNHPPLTKVFDALLSRYSVHPLQDTSVPKQSETLPETVLALLYLAMLSSARISHQLAYKSLQCLIEAGYHDIETLKQSTWQERTEVLTKGGYTRYREKTATALGELADFTEEKYGALYLNAGSPLQSL